jgi:preprotein translocase subunit SecF
MNMSSLESLESSNGSVVKSIMMKYGDDELLKPIAKIVTTCVATTVTTCVALTVLLCVGATVTTYVALTVSLCVGATVTTCVAPIISIQHKYVTTIGN